jgi:thioesterase-3
VKTTMEKRIMNYQTDSFGIVHHARYLEMMEEARWLYCYENKLMEAFHTRGIFHVIANINIDYKASARPGDLITIETGVSRVTEKSVIFRQVVSRDEQRLAVASITNVFMRKSDHSVIKISKLETFWDDLKRDKSLFTASMVKSTAG